MAMAEKMVTQELDDELTEALTDLFTNVSAMIKGDLQGTNNILKLLENMNLKVAEEYKGFGDVASGLRVFVERLKVKSENFDEYVQQIDAIEHQVTDLEVFEELVYAIRFNIFLSMALLLLPPSACMSIVHVGFFTRIAANSSLGHFLWIFKLRLSCDLKCALAFN